MLASLKIAFRVLLRNKFFTFISLFAICFTLVVLTVVTALIDATFGPVAPEKKIDRTLGVYFAQMRGEEGRRTGTPGYGLLDRYARDLPGAEAMSICTVAGPAYSYPNGRRVEMYLKRTDGAFWQVFDFDFLEGAPFTAEDEANGNRVAVINDSTRRRIFGGEAVGKSFDVDGQTFRVVGVVADVSILRLAPFSDVWVPLSTAKSDAYKKELVGNMLGLIVARDRSDFDQIRQEFQARMERVDLSAFHGFTEMRAAPSTFFEFTAAQALGTNDGRGNTTLFLGIIAVLMLLFMLLPTINLTNINVSRILERASEIGVRKAFGASSWSLVGQFLVENVVITIVGGLLAFALSQLVLSALSSSGLIPYADLRVNYRVFLYGLAIATVFGVVSGVYPAWKMSRLDPVLALKGGVR